MYSNPIEQEKNITSFVRLVKLSKDMQEEGQNVNSLVATGRFMAADSEPVKFVKFLQRQAFTFLSQQGLNVPIPEGARLIDNETGEELGISFIFLIDIIT